MAIACTTTSVMKAPSCLAYSVSAILGQAQGGAVPGALGALEWPRNLANKRECARSKNSDPEGSSLTPLATLNRYIYRTVQ